MEMLNINYFYHTSALTKLFLHHDDINPTVDFVNLVTLENLISSIMKKSDFLE